MSTSNADVRSRLGGNGNNSVRACTRWTIVEDHALVSAMTDLVELGGWKTDNGQFKSGAYAKLEAIMEQKLRGTQKKAKPHIESRVKLLRKQYDAIVEMMGPSASGFGWNDQEKCVTYPLSVWDEWVKSHRNAVGLRNKSFPFFDELGKIFGKDRATGEEVETADNALKDMEGEQRGLEEEPLYTLDPEEPNPTPQDTHARPTPTPSSVRTKRARTETVEAMKDFAAKMEKISEVMEAASDHIGRLANCFQHESDSATRRLQVSSEVMKIEGLTQAQVLLVSKKIAMNPLEVDFFFSLTNDYRYAYVQSLLLPDP